MPRDRTEKQVTKYRQAPYAKARVNRLNTHVPLDWKDPSVDKLAQQLGSTIVRLHVVAEAVKPAPKGVVKHSPGLLQRGFNGLKQAVTIRPHQKGTEPLQSQREFIDNLVKELNNCLVGVKDVLAVMALKSPAIAKYYTSFAGSFGYLDEECTSDIERTITELYDPLPKLEAHLPKLREYSDKIQESVARLFSHLEHDIAEYFKKTKDGRDAYEWLSCALNGIAVLGFMGAATGVAIATNGHNVLGSFIASGGIAGIGLGTSDEAQARQDITKLIRARCDRTLSIIRSIQALKHTIQDLHDELKGLTRRLRQGVPFSEDFTKMAQKPEVAAVIWRRMNHAINVYHNELASLTPDKIRDPDALP